MKRSEMILFISNKLQKSENIFKGYKKGSISLKCTCDNLSIYVLNEIEKRGMLPPYLTKERQYPDNLTNHSWEKEKEDE